MPAGGDHHPPIAREGWIYVGSAVGIAVLATPHLGWWSSPLWLVALFVGQFFRDPRRVVSATAGAVLCPADGRVIALGEVDDPYLPRRALKISVFMNVFNVHSNRAPVSGEVRARWYRAGAFVNAALDKASRDNESNALWIRTPAGEDVVVVQIAGLIARRILCYVAEGDTVTAGGRYGFIRFGSRVDLYLPEGSVPRLVLGDRVTAGRDVAALFGAGREDA